MKKFCFATAILAAAVICSCSRETDTGNGYVPQENGIAFYLQGTSTRSAEMVPQVNSIILDDYDDFVLEESVVSLDEDWFYVPETRGTPAYTENVESLYGAFNGVAYKNETTDLALADAEFTANSGKWVHLYDILDPLANGDLRFYMRMPADVIDAQCENFAYNADGSIEFDYTSPTTATEQRDMLFTSRTLSKSDYDPKTGAPLLFHHALTGVKFRVMNGDELDDLSIDITKIEFEGFQTSGHAKVVPDKEDNYKDNKTNYSSATAVTWGTSELEGKSSLKISEEFDGLIDYSASTTSLPAAFYAKDDTYNLNDANASKTFWFIPQIMTEGKTITVYFKINGNDEEQYFVLDVSKLKSVQWKAGDLRTYTFKINDVNVKIEDKVTLEGTANDGYEGSKKKAVKITNTGNTDAFIRAAIVGQWLDKNNNPVFGFTDEINNLYLVESWYQDQFGKTEEGGHGKFTGLPGYKGGPNPIDNWMLCEDGYYYYTEVVESGDMTETDLFTEYEVKQRPGAVSIAGDVIPTSEMHFELEIATQAISAKKVDGSYYTWQDAWEKALGAAPVKKQ